MAKNNCNLYVTTSQNTQLRLQSEFLCRYCSWFGHCKLNLMHHPRDCLRISRSPITQFGASV